MVLYPTHPTPPPGTGRAGRVDCTPLEDERQRRRGGAGHPTAANPGPPGYRLAGTASHARHVTHDTNTEHGTRLPGWEPPTSDPLFTFCPLLGSAVVSNSFSGLCASSSCSRESQLILTCLLFVWVAHLMSQVGLDMLVVHFGRMGGGTNIGTPTRQP